MTPNAEDGQISCIPDKMEMCILFSLGLLRFIDSDQVLLVSLEELAASSKSENFQFTAKFEPDIQRRQLLLRKGVLSLHVHACYMDSLGCFDEPLLPLFSQMKTSHNRTSSMLRWSGTLSPAKT